MTHFNLHEDGTFDVLNEQHIVFARALARATFRNVRGELCHAVTSAQTNKDTLNGSDGTVELALGFHDETIVLTVKNVVDEPIQLEALEVMECNQASGSAVHLGDASELFYLRQGWQSWSQTAVRSLSVPEIPYASDDFFEKHLPYGAAAMDERTSNGFMLLGRTGDANAVLLGFETGARQFGQIRCAVHGDDVSRVYATCFADGIRLDPGEAYNSEEFTIRFGVAGGLYDEYAKRTAHKMGRRGSHKTIQGWCSWYYYYGENKDADVRANLDMMRAANLPMDVVLVDDGYQAAIGDWTKIDAEKFPMGIRTVAQEIRAAGKIPGIWLAPFGVRRDSLVAQEHPDFLLRRDDITPVLAWTHWNYAVYALDLTHPDVQKWLRDLFHTVVHEWGFGAVKLDFIFAGALEGRHFDPTMTRAQAYRRGLEIIGEAVGKDCLILGCGAPQLASVGLVDSMRVSQDVSFAWEPGDPVNTGSVSTRFAVQNTIARAPLNQRWWLNDGDCVIVRQKGEMNGMTRNEMRTLASVAALTGSVILDSDNLATLRAAHLQDLRRILPPLEHTARVREWFTGKDEQPRELELSLENGNWVLGTINWSREARTTIVELPGDDAYHVFDFWNKKYLGVQRGRIKIARHAAHETIVLHCARLTKEPAVLASTFHIAGVQPLRLTHDDSSVEMQFEIFSSPRGQVLVNLPPRRHVSRARVNGRNVRVKEIGRGVVTVSFKGDTPTQLQLEYKWGR